MICETFQSWQSPPDLTVSQWADEYRYLSPEASAEPGKWRTDRAEYQRGIMDSFSDPRVLLVVIMSSAQVGKTEFLLNITGYFIDQDPSPMIMVMPTVQMGEAWSKDRLSTMLRDSAKLKDKVADAKSRDGNNTILHKVFPGGRITIVGANSPAGLSGRPVRVVLIDEVDRCPASAGSEGDPVRLALKRQNNFWNKKAGLTSTPTIAGQSRIEKAYNSSDKRKYYIPCPNCGKYQVLVWEQVKWSKNEKDEPLPDTSYYECLCCQHHLSDGDINYGVQKGGWISELLPSFSTFDADEFNKLIILTKENCKGVAGFHLNEIYSPWRRLAETVQDFLEAIKDTEQFITWKNTALGLPWEDDYEKFDEAQLLKRVESYNAVVPMGAVVLTCGVDVQPDRLELEIVGWGEYQESWGISYHKIYGDPNQMEVWDDLDDILSAKYRHESGIDLPISATCIDSGGHNTEAVYDYCRKRYSKRIFAIKGYGGDGRPIAGKKSKIKYGKKGNKAVKLFIIGVDQAKRVLFYNLKRKAKEAGFCHFPEQYDQEYFEGLTAEKITTVHKNGVAKTAFVKIRDRNEPLDVRVYALAALKLRSPNIEKLREKINKAYFRKKIEEIKLRLQGKKPNISEVAEPILEEEPVKKAKKNIKNKKSSNYANSWRYNK